MKTLWIAALLAAATAAVFAPALRCAFVAYDDPSYVTANEVVQRGLTPGGIAWAFTREHVGNWHPLTGLSHMLDCELFGLRPAGHHATSVLLHVANALLLFGWLAYATRSIGRSALVAALFALHPLRVESVAWISERKDVLSTFFGLLALWSWTAWTRRGGAARYAAALACLALGLMAKPMLVTLPFLLLLLDVWPLERGALPLKRRLTEKLLFFLLSAASCAVTYLVQHSAGAVGSATELPFDERAANAVVSYARYLGQTLWPSDLAVLYVHPNMTGGTPWTAVQVAGAAALVLAISGLVLASRRRPAIVGWLWYLGTFVPVIGLVQVGSQAMADRYTYVPSIGIAIAVVFGVGELVESAARRTPGSARTLRTAAAALALAVLGACALASRRQIATWRDSSALYEHALEVSPTSPILHYNLANLRHEQGRNAEALAHYQRAADLGFEHAPTLYNLGIALEDVGRRSEAIASYRRAVHLDPAYVEAHVNLGQALQREGDLDGAIASYRAALALAPSDFNANYDLGVALDAKGELDLALEHQRRAAAVRPEVAAVHAAIGWILQRQGRFAEAASAFREALRREPDWWMPQVALAWILAVHPDPAVRSPKEAVDLAERAVARQADAMSLDALAAAYAALGRFEDAALAADSAMRAAASAGAAEQVRAIRGRLVLYRASQAFTLPLPGAAPTDGR